MQRAIALRDEAASECRDALAQLAILDPDGDDPVTAMVSGALMLLDRTETEGDRDPVQWFWELDLLYDSTWEDHPRNHLFPTEPAE
jgi:hypothetical protein